MAGEFLYFSIYVLQQLGIMLGVGAQTVLLCTHMVALHRAEAEHPHATYARAARFALAVGLFLIVLSGVAAVAMHMLNGQTAVLLAPAFLFKWVLIVVLVGVFLLQARLSAWSNGYYAYAGATWYALFLVHSLGPVTSWTMLGVLYVLWLMFFTAVWALFITLMQWKSKAAVAVAPAKPTVKIISKPAPILQAPSPPPPPLPKPIIPPAPIIPKPAPVAVSAPPLTIKKPVAQLSPVERPLTLPKPLPPVPPVPPAAAHKPTIMQEIIDHLLVPALHIMPQKPEDISKQYRPPVVKLGGK